MNSVNSRKTSLQTRNVLKSIEHLHHYDDFYDFCEYCDDFYEYYDDFYDYYDYYEYYDDFYDYCVIFIITMMILIEYLHNQKKKIFCVCMYEMFTIDKGAYKSNDIETIYYYNKEKNMLEL